MDCSQVIVLDDGSSRGTERNSSGGYASRRDIAYGFDRDEEHAAALARVIRWRSVCGSHCHVFRAGLGEPAPVE
jgi:hypothetical protein